MKKIIMIMMAGVLFSACHENLEERAARECREYTQKHCPAPISDILVNDSMVFESASKTVRYYYTLRGVADTTSLNITNVREEMLNGIKNSAQLKTYKEAGFSFRYTYFSTKHRGKKLFDFTFTPKDYNK
ncbi:MAG: hypothetical protein IJK09_08885 [Prevotella sp.]|nr:hypothetical protein [Prevotella sp.]